MTISDAEQDGSAQADDSTTVIWRHRKRDLWVASRSEQLVGTVEFVAEHFVSCDAFGKRRLSHPDLRSAQRAVECGW
ncbi:hypothetical protein ACPPVQ_18710 [Diaminobutyricibacter sp. McL0618]|uniref:hypothetical protein n=1 Tax=Leifsonia sp. McL0618 TaxID=3415677 RepID=UPI003CEC62F0